MSLSIIFVQDEEKQTQIDFTGTSWEGVMQYLTEMLLSNEGPKEIFKGAVCLFASSDNEKSLTVEYHGGFTGDKDIICDMHAHLISNLAMESQDPKVFCGMICDKALSKVNEAIGKGKLNKKGVIVPSSKLIVP